MTAVTGTVGTARTAPTTSSLTTSPVTTVRVRQIRWEAEGVVSITLGRDDASPLPGWEPGEHLDLHLREGRIRQYSLCGDPQDRTTWTVAVRLEPEGNGGSRHVHDGLRVGELVEITGPRQRFALRDAPGYLFVAGGIGITPLLPMVVRAARLGLPWRLLYAGTRRSTLPFLDVLARYGDQVQVFATREGAPLDLATTLPTALADLPAGSPVYCCGPDRMLDAVTGLVGPGSLVSERFRPTLIAPPPDALAGGFEVEVGAGGQVLVVSPDDAMIDVLLDAGVDIEYSCREGICGTCETGVLAGVPDHRDNVLTEAERAAGTLVFPCVSRSLTARLTLDL
ncbi:oxidoreductase [Nakamurella flavida]|uniref:Oxidoreductase n=1 Tax=Nakamurella flavida TaxID=363630 RepID=A0A938YEQ0_9ACTN|nr:PDR/VanB family oxidoreductase [Nakamurella flavida]MBM9476301.1 oxidoreductase [Nakamurella flavida]MDP9779599.1 ferredoxin-NADP reductase [Nakamurella flavida]